MAKNYSKYLAGQMGESLVVAELGRRGVIATSFSGNLPEADIVAFHDGRNIHIQVKAMRTISGHLNAANFLDIAFDPPRQIVKGLLPLPNSDLIYAYVKLGEHTGSDTFFVLTFGDLQQIIYRGYRSYLDSKGGIRPKNPASTHCSISETDLVPFKDNWDLIGSRLGLDLSDPRQSQMPTSR